MIAPGPWAQALLADARAARRRSTSARRRATSSATGRCGPTGTSRRARSRSTRRCSPRADGRRPAGHPPRHGRAALHRRGQARHRRALGDLLQARPPRRPGRCLAARRRRRRRARPVPATTDVDPGFPDMWCAALSHAMSRFEGCRPLYKKARSRRRRLLHRRQLPRLRLPEAERVRDPRLEPRLQDDRRRARGGEGRASASTRACSTRSASSASRPATSTRSRTRRTPGARRSAEGRPTASSRAPRGGRAAARASGLVVACSSSVTMIASATRRRARPRRARPSRRGAREGGRDDARLARPREEERSPARVQPPRRSGAGRPATTSGRATRMKRGERPRAPGARSARCRPNGRFAPSVMKTKITITSAIVRDERSASTLVRARASRAGARPCSRRSARR